MVGIGLGLETSGLRVQRPDLLATPSAGTNQRTIVLLCSFQSSLEKTQNADPLTLYAQPRYPNENSLN